MSGKRLADHNRTGAGAHRYRIPHRHRAVDVVITEDDALELWLDGCLRKRRGPGKREPQYVWTNVELDWEEHHYIEARFYRGCRGLEVTVNGDPLFEARVGRSN